VRIVIKFPLFAQHDSCFGHHIASYGSAYENDAGRMKKIYRPACRTVASAGAFQQKSVALLFTIYYENLMFFSRNSLREKIQRLGSLYRDAVFIPSYFSGAKLIHRFRPIATAACILSLPSCKPPF